MLPLMGMTLAIIPPGDDPHIANLEFPREQLDESADVNMEENEEVTITPEVTSKKVCRDITCELVKVYRESHLGKCWQACDGRKSLYTAGSLPVSSKDFVVKLVDKDCKDRRERQFDVAINFALQQFLGGRQLDVPQETLQVLDVALPSAPSTNYVAVGRSFFSPSLRDTGTLGDGLQYWEGFIKAFSLPRWVSLLALTCQQGDVMNQFWFLNPNESKVTPGKQQKVKSK